MTSEAYDVLFETAARRIGQEWRCRDSERELLLLVAELSFKLQQSWACVPCLTLFATALGVHKSTVSRGIRRCCQAGYLAVMKHRGETLYSIAVRTRGPGAGAGAAAEQNAQESARTKLVEMQLTRLRGCADADGQGRLPGMFESEELDAPAAAFEAMMEAPQPAAASPASAAPETTSRSQPQESVPAGAGYFRSLMGSDSTPAVPPGTKTIDERFAEISRSLPSQAQHALEMLRIEARTAGPAHERHVIDAWGWNWRKLAKDYPMQLSRAVGAHKARRHEKGTRAETPGAWIWNELKHTLGSKMPEEPE